MTSGPRPGQTRRQEVIDTLCDAFARDQMELDEFERRVEAAHRADSVGDLDRLLSDLAPRNVPARMGRTDAPAANDGWAQGARPQATGHTRERETVVGVMGGATRRGRWTPAHHIIAIGIMGGVELDFRDAILPPGVTEVRAFAFWGGVQILAPPDVRVECSGVGIMGGFDHREEVSEASARSESVLRVTGVAIMGGVDVKVRYPGETGRDVRRRLKEQRRDRRLGRGGPDARAGEEDGEV